MELAFIKQFNNTFRLLDPTLVDKLPDRFKAEYIDRRSLSANAIQHVWIKDVSRFTGEEIKTVTNRHKLEFGLPIIAGSKAGEQIEWILRRLNFYSWPYEKQINFMGVVNVTSQMTTAQHKQMRDQVQAYYLTQGLELHY